MSQHAHHVNHWAQEGVFHPQAQYKIVFGQGKVRVLKAQLEELGGRRALLLSGKSVAEKTDAVRTVADALADRASQHDRDLSPAERDELRARVRGRVADLLDDWLKIADRKHNTGAGLQYARERGDAPPLLRDPLNPELNAVSVEERRFKANRSMRDVELSVNLWAKTLDGLDVAAEEE